MDCSPSGSSVHGILQARRLEWVAMPSSRGSSYPRDWTHVSCIAGRFFMVWASREAFVNHQKINQNPDKVLSSLLQLFSRRSSLILVNTLQPLEKPDFAPVIPISDEHQVFILFLFLFRIFSQWILKIKVEKLLCTLPNSFLLSTKMPFSLPSFLANTYLSFHN